MALSSTMKALVIQENRIVALQDRPIPTIDNNEVLIKTGAVALNNVEWKLVAFIGTTGTILGVDLAGEIVQVGKNVTQRKVGERVATFVHGAHYADRGAFADYVKASADLVWVLPETIAYEQAAAMTCGCIFISSLACLTASSLAVSGWKSRTDDIGERAEYGQHYSTKHDSASLVSLHPMSRQSRETSGSSSTAAAYAIQLLHTRATKSPRPVLRATSLSSPRSVQTRCSTTTDLSPRSYEATRPLLATRSGPQLTALADVIAPGGGKVAVLLPKVEIDERPDVQRIFLLLYTVLGRPFTMMMQEWPLAPSDKAQLVAFCENMPRLVEQGRLKPNLLKVWEGGLAAIPDGLQYMKEGKLSAEKIVYRL